MLGRSHIIWLPLLTSFSTINSHFAWSKFQVIENNGGRSGCRWIDKYSHCFTTSRLHANTLHLYGIEVVWTIISSGFLYLNRGFDWLDSGDWIDESIFDSGFRTSVKFEIFRFTVSGISFFQHHVKVIKSVIISWAELEWTVGAV